MYETAMHTKSNYIFLRISLLYLIFASTLYLSLSLSFASNLHVKYCYSMPLVLLNSIQYVLDWDVEPKKGAEKSSLNALSEINDFGFTIDDENRIIYKI